MPPAMVNNLTCQYFYLDNREADPIGRLLDCNIQCIYYTFKKQVKSCQSYCYLFLQGLCFHTIQLPDGSLYHLDVGNIALDNNVFKFDVIQGKGFDALGEIETKLDQGEQVIIYTPGGRLPFLNSFRGFDSVFNEKTGHHFLLVAHQGDYVYYVENPFAMNATYASVNYSANPSIFMLRKEEMKPAFDAYIRYTTVKIDLTKHKINMKKVIKYDLKRFCKRKLNQNGVIYSYGQDAMEVLIELCRNGIDLNKGGNLYSAQNLYELLQWKFWVIASRRELLKLILLNTPQKCNTHVRRCLIENLTNQFVLWEKGKNLLMVKYAKRNYQLGEDLLMILLELKDLEYRMVKYMHKLWSLLSR